MPPRRDARGRFIGSGVDVDVRRQIEVRDKVIQVERDLRGRTFMDAMTRATLIVEGTAKRLAPVDTGRLRGSIASEIRKTPGIGGETVQGVVGTSVDYAAAVHEGSRPHWVPIRALEVWARRHKVNAYAVQRAIARRGTRARPFLRDAFAQNRARIVQIIGQGVTTIVRK